MSASPRMVARLAFSGVRSARNHFARIPTPVRFAHYVVAVPPMGDSITEGTLLSFEKGVGESVEIDEVVAVIETDKVNVEVRAPFSGVLTEFFASADDDVAVGSDLFKLDSDGAATAAPVEAKSSPSTDTPPAAPEREDVGTSPVGRAPSIHFLGKAGWHALRNGEAPAVNLSPGGRLATAPAPAPAAPVQHTAGAVDLWELPGDKRGVAGRFGCTPLSEEEMDAVELGGASLPLN